MSASLPTSALTRANASWTSCPDIHALASGSSHSSPLPYVLPSCRRHVLHYALDVLPALAKVLRQAHVVGHFP
eukprot:CAMPEP_0206321144 /NCGR_PEP_ID=MMETSP0106_2-20121207/18715_1 /ASSEMBLY_ACC=CAM_ASM_000206 /TAXON_ID=81532 /ORGANISM="Acanthoeca-like sp., Strain 10tr" /LENGTH=72 /DNA_ID=CAMNT_0053753189 /DNA_START=84 /DNA_END=299 /DNA_ORIENTATION=+